MNISTVDDHGCYTSETSFIFYVLTLTIACIGLPLTLVAIFTLYSMVRKDHVAPIYVINLLITDLIQLSCFIALGMVPSWEICPVMFYILHISVMVNICFMVVVSLERYLIISWPLWYRFRRDIKTSVIVCVVVWLLPLLYLPIFFFAVAYIETVVACFLILPFPLLIFFLVGTLKALSAARSVPPDEKRRIVAILVLVLLTYFLLFLPRIIFSLAENSRDKPHFEMATLIPVCFSPLADLVLYVFMRKGISDKLLALLCCCKMDPDDMSATENGITLHSGSSALQERKEGETVEN